MKVFVTGGSGYVGRAVVSVLIERGVEVSALARSEASAKVLAGLGAAPVAGSLRDTSVLYEGARAADGVVHLGQHSGPDTAAVDLAAASALADGAGPRPYVHTGGSWVYGDTVGVAHEGTAMTPPAITAWRLENERAVLQRAATGERPVVVQPGLVYGRCVHAVEGGERTPVSLIESFYAAPGRAAGAVPCIGDGSNHWSLVHVDDLAALYVLALSAQAGAVYLGVGEPAVTAGQVAQAVSRAIGHPGSVRHLTQQQAVEQMGPIAGAFALDQQLTSAKARRELGWAPVHADPLEELARG
ncbi:MAG: NAD-dependent epimerase/dehydratase family protein [Actinocrinis sp.]